jgi:uncharacterized glyoxalase superfamily protein PhnB
MATRRGEVGVTLSAMDQTPTPRIRPRLTVLTIGVDDVARSVAFYRDGLGWPTPGILGSEEDGQVAFFTLASGLQLAVWPRASIARDAGLPVAAAASTEHSLGYNVASETEVDQVWEAAVAAGATPTKPPARTFWGGYGGYFQDPDGHLWEVVYNPELIPAD